MAAKKLFSTLPGDSMILISAFIGLIGLGPASMLAPKVDRLLTATTKISICMPPYDLVYQHKENGTRV